MRYALILAVMLTLSCTKDEVPVSMSFANSGIKPKVADTVFTSLTQLMKYATAYDALPVFLSQTLWQSYVDQIYTVAPNADTVYSHVSLSGQTWSFTFSISTNGGVISITSTNAVTNRPIKLEADYFILDQTKRYDISEVALNTDSTFSFTLRNSTKVDTLQRLHTIKLQSY